MGPCASFDTACSSSLVALHSAVIALTNLECPSAALAGTNILNQEGNFEIAAAGMMSAQGQCYTFDARANGYLRAEGAGFFVLSSNAPVVLSEVIMSVVRQDGPSASLTAPNGSS